MTYQLHPTVAQYATPRLLWLLEQHNQRRGWLSRLWFVACHRSEIAVEIRMLQWRMAQGEQDA